MRTFLAAFVLSLFAALAPQSGPNQWYVSPAGSSANAGTQASPWDLCSVIGCGGAPVNAKVLPGDTIWLTCGTYTRGSADEVDFNLYGTNTQPIWIRNIKHPTNCAGQLNPDGSARAIIDPQGLNGIYVKGAFQTVDEIEADDSTMKTGGRTLSPTSNCIKTYNSAPLCPPAALGFQIDGPGDRLVHSINHDMSEGIYSYTSGPNSVIYGNLSYYNGYLYNGGGLAHGYYMQNSAGNKWLQNNLAGDNLDNGFQLYGSGGAVEGFIADGNVTWDNGSLAAAWQYNVVIGSASGTSGNVWNRFYSFFPMLVHGGYMAINQYDPGSQTSFTNSVFAGGYLGVLSEGLSGPGTSFTGNRIVNTPVQDTNGGPAAAALFAQLANQTSVGLTWDNNQYYGLGLFTYGGPGSYANGSLSNSTSGLNFAAWQKASGFDTNSSYSATLPTGNWTYVLPDAWSTKRANIVIYNWDAYSDQAGDIKNPCTGSCAAVSVDVSSVLSAGDPFVIVDAENYFGSPVVSGTYAGGSVSIPLVGLSKPVPWGMSTAPPHTAPAFGVFIVLSPNSADIPQPAQPATAVPPPSNGGGGTPPPPAATPLFTVGQSVKVNALTSAFSLRPDNNENPLSPPIGTEANGAVGTIVGGPTPDPLTGAATDILWQVQFPDKTGWGWQSLLSANGTAPPATCNPPNTMINGVCTPPAATLPNPPSSLTVTGVN